MNDQMNAPTPAAVIKGAPEWLTLPFVLIGLGILVVLLAMWWGMRLAKRRLRARKEIEVRDAAHVVPQTPRPPVHPAPPPLAEPPLAPPPPAEPEPLADEPIAAAAPLDASPATLAADIAEPSPEPVQPPRPAADDDLTRLKGLGPRVATRLHELGITGIRQLAALTPAEADALDDALGSFKGRLQRDRWIEQARFLAAGDVAGFEANFGKL